MISSLCAEPYHRPDGTMLRCQYLANHPADNHSWWAASMQDRLGSHPRPVDVDVLLGGIAQGWYDPYLEAILAGAHARKRDIRGVSRPYGVASSE